MHVWRRPCVSRSVALGHCQPQCQGCSRRRQRRAARLERQVHVNSLSRSKSDAFAESRSLTFCSGLRVAQALVWARPEAPWPDHRAMCDSRCSTPLRGAARHEAKSKKRCWHWFFRQMSFCWSKPAGRLPAFWRRAVLRNGRACLSTCQFTVVSAMEAAAPCTEHSMSLS
jgi:hypothetical protein